METVNSNAVTFHGGYSEYNGSGFLARTALENDHSWAFTDGGPAPQTFNPVWASQANQILSGAI
jgi:hypothetical protein